MMTKYIILILLLIIWCAVHSAMISISVTEYLKRRMGTMFCYYRLFFNFIALLTFIPIILYSSSLTKEPVFYWEGYLSICQILLLLTAAVLVFLGARSYDAFQFLGISQIREGKIHRTLTDSGELDTNGIFGFLRHPVYTGVILILWARAMDATAIILNLIFTAYFIVGAFLEERKLTLEFGETYRDYKKTVSMFFPYKWLRAKYKYVKKKGV